MAPPNPPQTKTPTRSASLSDYNNDTIGACIYLTRHDLYHLGVDPANAQEIEYTVNTTLNIITITAK